MADEQLDGTDMIDEFLGKRQRLTYQARHALAQCVVEPLDVIGCARQCSAPHLSSGWQLSTVADVILPLKWPRWLIA
jgi:hypothetical protein